MKEEEAVGESDAKDIKSWETWHASWPKTHVYSIFSSSFSILAYHEMGATMKVPFGANKLRSFDGRDRSVVARRSWVSPQNPRVISHISQAFTGISTDEALGVF